MLSNERNYNFRRPLKKLFLNKFLVYLIFLFKLILRLGQNFKNLFNLQKLMKDKLYDNADSFAMSFDEEWKNVDCEDLQLKIDKVFELLSDHPFLVSNPINAKKMAEFRVFSLKKFS